MTVPAVCELTSLITDHKLPEGTRLIVRREPLHPGAQRSLFPESRVPLLGLLHRRRGNTGRTRRHHAGPCPRRATHPELKDSGLCRMPFTSFEANANWMMAVAMSADLVRWFQLLCFDGSWVDARPKAMRWGIFHAPGRLIHESRQRVVRIIDGWPGTDALLDAYKRIALIT